MRNKFNSCLCGFVFIVTVGCSDRTSLSKSEYLEFVNSEESGLIQIREIGGEKYKLKLTTSEALALNNSNIKRQDEFIKECENYKESINFNLTIQDKEQHSSVKNLVINNKIYSDLLAYANSDMNKDFFLVLEKDTIPCGIVYLEPANSTNPVLRISLGFPKRPDKKGDYTLCFNDNIFDNGVIKFNFSQSEIDNLPEVIF